MQKEYVIQSFMEKYTSGSCECKNTVHTW